MSSILSNIDGQDVKLSNLEKVLWPEENIAKAELIQYYLSVKSYVLKWMGLRPLTLIRFPDGIQGEKFYSKNAAAFTPSWVSSIQVEDIKYLYIKNSADLVYIINLAALELHAMTVKSGDISTPDQMIFDLDPSEDVGFENLKEICFNLTSLLSDLGYHPHVKTTGGKGLHIYVPVNPIYTREEVFEASKRIGQIFTDKYPVTTLKMSKERRQGKVLIDIYRNHNGQTCVAPLSTRAKPGAPVSMPILMEHLANLTSSNQYNIHNVAAYLGTWQPWSSYENLGVNIHDLNKTPKPSSKLETYAEKRNFSTTPEPPAEVEPKTQNNRFVIQKHNASNLHYDLRLEEDGVLTSWAIPKSIPTQANLKRLAIRTEDHPIKYLHFEGEIPKDEYGGGTMWIFDHGTYDIIKKENDKSYKILLLGHHIKGEYLIFHTRDNQWIIERKDSRDIPFNTDNIGAPMLAEQVTTVPSSQHFFFELKWDGIRVSIFKQGQTIIIFSKSGRDISKQFPDVIAKLANFDAEDCILDGELVSLDSQGAPVFSNIISRMHSKTSSAIDNAIRLYPAVLYLFDLRYIDGIRIHHLPIEKRRAWLSASLILSETVRLSEAFDDGETLFAAAKSLGLEGIMAKKKGSKYTENKRSFDWVKIKVRTLVDVFILGYTKGNGDRSNLFGALHVGKINDEGALKYLGKVGTGWDEAKMREILQHLQAIKVISKPIKESIEEEHLTIWIEPVIECEVQYASLTSNGTLREPVFYRLKIDGE
jgi:bifunctional non-homologous end joining protein LigD